MKTNIFWFRRDLRLHDNAALFHALNSGLPVLPVFIFDSQIIDELDENDARISFIYESLDNINNILTKSGSSLIIIKDNPINAFERLNKDYSINCVYANEDYEPYAIHRDKSVSEMLNKTGVDFKLFKDQVVFSPGEIIKSDGKPYTVYTAYKNKFLSIFEKSVHCKKYPSEAFIENFLKCENKFPDIKNLGFKPSSIRVKTPVFENIVDYDKYRDYPALDYGTFLGPYLRFGLFSIREISIIGYEKNLVFFSELIWREFFMQILYFFPDVVTESFRKKYDNISWRNDDKEFEIWCKGETGYPIVDAGMKQLNTTGYMHNRVRMICSSFLVKHLLTDWRRGEAYFGQKLLDYDLSSNNGNWQWAAGTGCDAAPYFRVFNPLLQQKKFDKDYIYINRYINKFNMHKYLKQVVDHNFARDRAIDVYRNVI